MERETGAPLTGWPHVLQSITMILKTPLGSRVMRRDFGSNLPDLIDKPMNQENILRVYTATFEALRLWEPRFQLTGVALGEASSRGVLALDIRGEYLGRLVDGQIEVTA